MRCTALGTADVPTVSLPGRGDQLHRAAQSAELPDAHAGWPSRGAAERRGFGIPRVCGKGLKVMSPFQTKQTLKFFGMLEPGRGLALARPMTSC